MQTQTVRADTILIDGTLFCDGEVDVIDGLIGAVRHGTAIVVDPAPGATVLSPGFIDLQVNGLQGDGAQSDSRGVDLATTRADDIESWQFVDQTLLAQGTTAWCPTLISHPLDETEAWLDVVARVARQSAAGHPHILGAHLEGPFLGSLPGAHNAAAIVAPNPTWLGANLGGVAIVTLGAEAEATTEAVAAIVEAGAVASIGHTAPTAAQASTAFDAGATMVTHLFNAMGPLHHRSPGLIGAALADPRVTVGLIADGHHVDPTLLPVVFAAKGPSGVVLVTDAVGRGGSDPARPPRLSDGTLAGSNLTMPRAIGVCTSAGVSVADALTAATATPAATIGDEQRGLIAVGRRADLVELLIGDEGPEVLATMVGGTRPPPV